MSCKVGHAKNSNRKLSAADAPREQDVSKGKTGSGVRIGLSLGWVGREFSGPWRSAPNVGRIFHFLYLNSRLPACISGYLFWAPYSSIDRAVDLFHGRSCLSRFADEPSKFGTRIS